MSDKGSVKTKVFNTTINILYTVLFMVAGFIFVIALIALILAAISFNRTSDLSSNKMDISNFTVWNTLNGTLYKNSFTDNVVLLDDVPISWTQAGQIVYVRLPFLSVSDTLLGNTLFLELHIINADAIPFITPDVLPWGSSSSVTVGGTIFFINSGANDRSGDIIATEYTFPDGQSFIYELNNPQAGAIPNNSEINVRGIAVQYTTPVFSNVSTASIMSQYTTQQIIQSIRNGGKLPPLLK
jgi:hypothetical protein